jgi:hypothetical protein
MIAGLVGMADNPVEQRFVTLLDDHAGVSAGRAGTRDARRCCWLALVPTPESAFAGFVYLAVICHRVDCHFLMGCVRLRCRSLCLHCYDVSLVVFFLLLLVSLPE